MIRWRYLLTRVLIVVLIIVLARWALGPAARYATIESIQAATGGRVDIAQAHVDLWPPRLYYENVQIADPSKSHEDAVRADLIDIQLKPEALLRRQWVIEKARITGINLNEERSTTGRLAKTKGSSGAGFSDKLAELIESQAKAKAGEFKDSLETIQVSDAIRNRWKAEYVALSQRAAGLETAVREVS